MGQYYMPILGDSNGLNCEVFDRSVDDEYMLAKLMEHSWWNNPFCNAFAERLYNQKKRVCWVGDYANEPEDFNFDLGESVKNPSYEEVWGEGINLQSVDSTDFTLDNKFLLNYDTKQYVDLNEYKKKSMDKDSWIINPLPLLTAVGNGRGGGDFSKGYIGYKNVGIWAWNLLSISDIVPKNFKKLEVIFKEENEKLQVLTLEIDHELKGIFPHVREIDSTDVLNEMYKIIGCEMIDIVQIEAEGKNYDVYCDDEFLLKEKPVPTLYLDNENVLCGNLVFTTCDEEGNVAEVSDDDIKILTEYILVQAFKLHFYFGK